MLRNTSMQLHLELAAAVVGLSLFNACSGVPLVEPSRVSAPTAVDLATPPSPSRSTVQRVEETGSGGGSQSPCLPTEICLELKLTAGATLLFGSGRGPHDPSSSALNFAIAGFLAKAPGGINQTPAGAVLGVFSSAKIDLSVNNGSATVALTLSGPFDNTQKFAAAGTAPVIQSQTTCSDRGTRSVTTTVTVELEHLGRTTIVAWGTAHCTP